jgi:hypothetical protein
VFLSSSGSHRSSSSRTSTLTDDVYVRRARHASLGLKNLRDPIEIVTPFRGIII